MLSEVVCGNVFEAIGAIDPANPACNGATRDGSLLRRQEYAAVPFADGSIGLVEKRDSSLCMRGETSLYPTCKAGLFRIADVRERIVAQAKAQDFMQFLSGVEAVRQWRVDGLHLDPLALAQHYGFATEMLDLTCDVVVAAFFATHRYDTRKLRYEIVSEGVGRIRYARSCELDGRVFPLGLQPLQRPGLQSGLGILLADDDDFAQMSDSICFRQDEKMNRRFSRAILANALMLPDENMASIASSIRDAPVVTSAAVRALCSAGEMREGDVLDALANCGVSVVDAPLVAAGDYAQLNRLPRTRVRRVAVTRPAGLSSSHM